MVFGIKRHRDNRNSRPASSTAKYYRTNSTNSSRRSKNRPLRPRSHAVWPSRVGIIVILTATIAFIIWHLIVGPPAKLTVNDTVYHDKKIYQDYLDGQLRKFFNRNKLTFNAAGLSSDLTKQFPELSQVAITLSFFADNPKVNLTVAKPVLLLSAQTGSYVVNEKGVVVDLEAGFAGSQKLINVSDESGLEISRGKTILNPQAINFINDLNSFLTRHSVPVKSFSLPAKAQELYLYTTDTGYYVKFNLGGNLAAQASQLLAVRNQFTGDGTQPSQYLDVRVQGKAFYR